MCAGVPQGAGVQAQLQVGSCRTWPGWTTILRAALFILESAKEAAGAVHAKVIPAVISRAVLGVGQCLAGLDGITAGNAIKMQLVINVEHRTLRSGIYKCQFYADSSPYSRMRMQFIRQLARETGAGFLE